MMDFWTLMGTSIWNDTYRNHIDALCRGNNPQKSLFDELVMERKKLLTRFEIGEVVRFFGTDRGHESNDVQVLMEGIRALIAKQMEGLDDPKSAFLFLLIMDKKYSDIVLNEKMELEQIPCYEKFGIDVKALKVFRKLMALDQMEKVTRLFREGRWTITQDCPMLISLDTKYNHANAGCLLHKLESARKGKGEQNPTRPKSPSFQ